MKKAKPAKLFETWFLVSLLILFSGSIIAGLMYNILGFSFVKQVIGFVFSGVAYYTFIRFNKFNIRFVFDLYLKVAYWVAVIGVFEEFGHMIGLHFLFKHLKTVKLGFYRVWSIMGEPYFLAVVLIPALFYYGSRLLGNKSYADRKVIFKFGIIFLCTVFTFSSAGYMAIAMMLVMIAYQKGFFSFRQGKIVFLPFVFIGLFALFNYVKENFWEFKTKITQTYEAFNSVKVTQIVLDQMNSTTFALYSNFKIAQQSFERNKLLGSGLGSHSVNYDKMFTDQFDAKYLERFGELNKYDANSLFIRLLSETGLLGLGMFFLFMFKFRLKAKHVNVPELAHLVIINQGIFILFIVRLVRTGNYIGNGFFFFFFLYYFTCKQVMAYYKNQQIKPLTPATPSAPIDSVKN